ERVRALGVRLAAAGGQRLDDAAPVVDARLPDGTRLHAVLPPIADPDTLLSLRVHRPRGLSFDELVRLGSVAPVLEPVLRALVAGRANVLVSGATGTGKTTLLSALLSLVPADERIVCIEEAAELRPEHPHVVRLVARRPNVEGAGEVDLASLVRHALRMRPDRVVLGECRGADVREVLSALNTGHDGGCATLHANAVGDVPARLEALGALAGMTPRAVAAQAASALDAVVHLRRAQGLRYVAEVAAVSGGPGGLLVDRVLACGPAGELEVGATWPVVARRWGVSPVVT
ncbi:MAG: Flp pilus assembly complex ATPase component TadA, partial [Actinotalea sp.]|nr:Flp pilus assembly complex ATPase component TadA [Actinotalea sp.]